MYLNAKYISSTYHFAVDVRTQDVRVSIHDPRARGDIFRFYLLLKNNVSIHAPRVRGDSSKSGSLIQR